MTEIFRQYGQTVLVVVSALLLVSLLFVTWPSGEGSVVTDIGDRTAGSIDNSQTGGVNPAFDEYAKRQPPTVTITGTAIEEAEVDLIAVMKITDSEGGVWESSAGVFIGDDGAQHPGSVQVISIRAENADTKNPEFDPATGHTVFGQAGLYTVDLRILDRYSVAASFSVPIVVDFAPESPEGTP